MRRLLPALLALLLPAAVALAEDPPVAEQPAPADTAVVIEDAANPLALVKTSLGDFVVELFVKETPETVGNFLGLAEGTKEFTDPVSGEKVKRHYFDGQIFHRVIDGFMIQGGDIQGTGSGGPGYRFKNEINGKALGLDKIKAVDVSVPGRPVPHKWLQTALRDPNGFGLFVVRPVYEKLGITSAEEAQARMKEIEAAVGELTLLDVYQNMGFTFLDEGNSHPMKRGTLAMANAGPGTNGSQFYVNLVDNEYLNGKHTVFGRVVKGMDVVEKIGKVKVSPQGNRPIEEVKILSVRRLAPEQLSGE